MAEPTQFDPNLLAQLLMEMQAQGRIPAPQKAQVGAAPFGMPSLPPMPQQPPGEMRSANEFPLSDLVAEKTGLTAAGPAVDMVAKLGRSTGNAAAGLTMLPWAYETGSQLGEALANDPLMQGSMVSPAQAQTTRLTKKQRQDLEIERQRAEREEARRGREKTQDATALEEQRKKDLAFELQAEAERRNAETNLTWRERNPAWANALPNYGMALAAGMPFGIAAMRNARTFFPGSGPGQMRTAIAESEGARAANNPQMAALRDRELANLLEQQPTMATEARHAGQAALGGGALSAESQMFPDQWDAFNLPEGQARTQARERALNPLEYVKRGGMGALTGASGYEAGRYMTPWRDAPTARAQALVDMPFSPAPHWTRQNRSKGRFATGFRE